MGKKYTYEDIKKEFQDRGYELLSNEYKNCETKLQYICKNHKVEGIQEIDYNHFHNRNQGCKYCGLKNFGMSERISIETLKELTESKGFIYCGYNFTNGRSYINYKCKLHLNKGIQTMSYQSMKKSTGKCSYCYGRHKTTSDFVNEMYIKNPNIEILGEYINATTKIKCRCLLDNYEWYAKPNLLLFGTGCPKCGIEKSRINSTKSHKQFVEEMLQINPNITFLSEYKNVKEKIKCKCLVCNTEFSMTPDSLLTGNGCNNCTLIKSHEKQAKSNNQFLQELKKVNPNILPLEKYYNDHTKIKCKCLIHNYIWYASPNKILRRKTGCPKCVSYHNENVLDEILDNWGYKYEVQKRIKDCKDKHTLPFDRYLTDFGIFIEYDGEQHYKPIRRGSMTQEQAEINFLLTKKHDQIKNEYCKNHNIPLIRIPYWEREEMECFLFDKLVKYGVIEEIKSA